MGGYTLSTEGHRIVFTYMLLGRMQSDCEFFLGFGDRNPKYLHQLNVSDQIREMKRLWNSLPDKPEWLSLEDINAYETKMKEEVVHV